MSEGQKLVLAIVRYGGCMDRLIQENGSFFVETWTVDLVTGAIADNQQETRNTVASYIAYRSQQLSDGSSYTGDQITAWRSMVAEIEKRCRV